jgi:hypothetical protein
MKFLPSVAPIEQLLGDISKNIKSRDPTHLAHYLKQAANFNLGSRKLQTVDLYRKKRTLLAFKKKITHTHTHKNIQMLIQHLFPPNQDVQEKKVKYKKMFFLEIQPSQRYHFFHYLQI